MIERLTCPLDTNKFYIKSPNGYSKCILGNPKTRLPKLNVLPNCVGYAWGRFNEINGKWLYYCKGNAGDLYANCKKIGLQVGYEPKLGGMMVWQNAGAGHVAIVEQIISSNKIVTSESEYNGKAFRVYTRTNSKGNWSDGIAWQSKYTYVGCVYNPAKNMEYVDLQVIKPNKEITTVEAINVDGTNYIKARDNEKIFSCKVSYNKEKKMPEFDL